jgi:hypothetical protein
MDRTVLDTGEQGPNLDRAPDPSDEASLAGPLELAYGARMRAVLHGAATAQAKTAQEVEHLERLCLERRQSHHRVRVHPVRVEYRDPSYYLG